MPSSIPSKPIDYLLIGHITEDVLPGGGSQLGGTASFSGYTASALGHEVGIFTSCSSSLDLSKYQNMQVYIVPSATTTTFRNIPGKSGRTQYVYSRASALDRTFLPETWKSCPIVHLGPVADEIDPDIYKEFPGSMICLTPQGWLRKFDSDNLVHPTTWHYPPDLLQAADVTILSQEDLGGSEVEVENWAKLSKLFVLTENKYGCRVYFQGETRHFSAPEAALVEDTGAGDIFAACFFHRFFKTRDPWEAARFATILAAHSVTRRYLESVPTQKEIRAADLQAEGR